MVEHIVLFKLKPATMEEQIQTLTQGLLKMADEISGIEEISAGVNTNPEGLNRGYNYGLIVRFVDAKARDAYIPHPFHQRVVKEYIVGKAVTTLLELLAAHGIVVDFFGEVDELEAYRYLSEALLDEEMDDIRVLSGVYENRLDNQGSGKPIMFHLQALPFWPGVN